MSCGVKTQGDWSGILFLAGVSLKWGGVVVFPRQSASTIQTIEEGIS